MHVVGGLSSGGGAGVRPLPSVSLRVSSLLSLKHLFGEPRAAIGIRRQGRAGQGRGLFLISALRIIRRPIREGGVP